MGYDDHTEYMTRYDDLNEYKTGYDDHKEYKIGYDDHTEYKTGYKQSNTMSTREQFILPENGYSNELYFGGMNDLYKTKQPASPVVPVVTIKNEPGYTLAD